MTGPSARPRLRAQIDPDLARCIALLPGPAQPQLIELAHTLPFDDLWPVIHAAREADDDDHAALYLLGRLHERHGRG